MRKLIKYLIAVGMLVCCQKANAGPFEDGFAAYHRSDYETALRIWKPLAIQGNTQVEFFLAAMYEHGYGVPQDHNEAMRLYRLAAEHGNANAQFSLGVMYSSGEGVTQDYKEAAKWFRLGAENGDPHSLFNLGYFFNYGYGVPQNYIRARMWYSLGSDSGDLMSVKFRDFIDTKMTPAQIAQAEEMARKCRRSNYKDCG